MQKNCNSSKELRERIAETGDDRRRECAYKHVSCGRPTNIIRQNQIIRGRSRADRRKSYRVNSRLHTLSVPKLRRRCQFRRTAHIR